MIGIECVIRVRSGGLGMIIAATSLGFVYEAYRARLRTDDAGAANFPFAEERRLIVAEERTFLRPVG